MSEDFATYIQNSRAKIGEDRRRLDEQMSAIKTQIAELERESAAIDAYEAAKTGKTAKASSNGGTQRRARNGSRREELLKLIGESNGLSRGEILERMGLKGDKAGEMSVSNALTALGKSGQVRREGGRYYPAATVQQDALQQAAE